MAITEASAGLSAAAWVGVVAGLSLCGCGLGAKVYRLKSVAGGAVVAWRGLRDGAAVPHGRADLDADRGEIGRAHV